MSVCGTVRRGRSSFSPSLGGLPKKTQTFFFFRIDKDRSGAVDEFRKQLSQLIPLITFNDQSKKDHDTIDNNKGKGLLKISGVNLAFTQEGLATVSYRFC